MKRIIIIISSAFIICLFPFSHAKAQEKKTEKKIKIIVSDDSGTKVVIDTLLCDGSMNDSIRLKDGKVIYIGHQENDDLLKPDEKTEKIFVTVTSDGKDRKKEYKEITVTCSHSADLSEVGEHSKAILISDDNDTGGNANVKYRVISKSLKSDGDKDQYFYIKEGKSSKKEMEKTFDVLVTGDDKESGIEKTRYVIAKDGMVVTVESSDEAKAKELIKEIENKLGVNTEGGEKKEKVKTETKKTIKK
ncbi:MAG: hypothetical protein EPN88_13555 [Bacteroidetes bacterium]|nr:MAG: hypothetical protein EPN88_13555 [Bacteroidota bacterium]